VAAERPSDGATVSAAPSALARHLPAIAAALDRAAAALADELAALDPALEPAAHALVGALGSGKRLRPALACWSFETHGGGEAGAVLGPAVALELVHTCALLHDDIIDRAETRRGLPTVHAAFRADHAQRSGSIGSAADYGQSVAILLGDVALAAADAWLLAAEVTPAALQQAHAAFTRLRVEVMAGQFLDVDATARGEVGRERALSIATLKSGRYSVARPLELGALLAGASPVAAAAVLAVGDPLGRAFQLRDDLLGVFGDEATTGKPAGADLVEGKPTLLVAETLARAADGDAARFRSQLGRAQLTGAEVDELRALIVDCGARAAVEAQVEVEVASARERIDRLELSDVARAELHELATWLVSRSA